jgi:hypothetical protein
MATRKLWGFVGAGLAWVLGSYSLAYSQVEVYRYTYQPVEHWVALSPEGRLQIRIPELSGGRWVVGVNARGSGEGAQLTATWVKSRTSTRGKVRIFEEFAQSELTMAPGKVVIVHQPAPGRDLAVWCSMPFGAQLVIQQAGKEVFAGRIIEDLIVVNGMIMARPAPHPTSSFFALAGVPDPVPATWTFKKRGDRTIAHWDVLKRNAVRLERPQLSPQAGCCQGVGGDGGVPAAVFTLEILVGEDGKVRDVRHAGGHESDFINHIAGTVRRWEFRPILVNGKPTEVSVRLPFTVTRSGQVLSPVF